MRKSEASSSDEGGGGGESIDRLAATVNLIELIRDKSRKNRGYGFVTMASGDESQAVIDKFNSTDYIGRSAPYTKRELDEVREQWARFFRLNFLLSDPN